MTQMVQEGALQNPGQRQSSKDSDRPSHRSHASQTQYAGGYTNGQGTGGQSGNDSMSHAMSRQPDVAGGGNKVKRTHNSQRARNATHNQNFA